MRLSFIKAKMFTKEDKHYLHKTLGLASVLSFLYRYAVVYPKKGELGFRNDWGSWLTMLVHVALSTSSLIFHVLARRIIKSPMIIYEEYRLHAIVFTLRCFSVFLMGLVFAAVDVSADLQHLLLFAVVMAHHLVVDRITQIHGTAGVTAVRVEDKAGIVLTVLKRGYAFYQFLAIGSHLLPNPNLADLGFNTLIAIQSSAFLMTLYRKGLVEQHTHAFWYTTCLVVSGYHMLRLAPDWWFLAKVMLVFAVRTRWRVSKYPLWALFSLSISPVFIKFAADFSAVRPSVPLVDFSDMASQRFMPSMSSITSLAAGVGTGEISNAKVALVTVAFLLMAGAGYNNHNGAGASENAFAFFTRATRKADPSPEATAKKAS